MFSIDQSIVQTVKSNKCETDLKSFYLQESKPGSYALVTLYIWSVYRVNFVLKISFYCLQLQRTYVMGLCESDLKL